VRRREKAHVLSAAQVRAARGLLAWSVERLAHASGFETETLRSFEAADAELAAPELQRLATALRQAGVALVWPAIAGAGVRFRSPPMAAPEDEHANGVRGDLGDGEQRLG